MISVIVPVYNVELYLRKCLDSIVGQTYRDLEIILIDDGSTDRSGIICDQYTNDERVRVIHTKNRGLSCARNLGLDEANGEWIGFVDSDDWIEPDMYEVLLKRAEETGADIVECGVFTEYLTRMVQRPAIIDSVANEEALNALINGSIVTQVWNKIYRESLFNSIRFPDGKLFEDVFTTHKLLIGSKVTGISDLKYHYIQRKSSISHKHDLQNIVDYWNAHKQRYLELRGIVDENLLLRCCAVAVGRAWAWYLKTDADPVFVSELSEFTCRHFQLLGPKTWPIYLRVSVFLARFNNRFSYSLAYVMNQIYRLMKLKEKSVNI